MNNQQREISKKRSNSNDGKIYEQNSKKLKNDAQELTAKACSNSNLTPSNYEEDVIDNDEDSTNESENDDELKKNSRDQNLNQEEELDFDYLNKTYTLESGKTNKLRAWVWKHFTKFTLTGVKR